MDRSAVPYLVHRLLPDEPENRIVLSKFPFVVGRASEADLTVPSRRVSKQHAVIEQRDDRYFVRDLGSRNGTFVDGERVDGEAELVTGALLHVGTTELRFGIAPVAFDEPTDSTMLGEPELVMQDLRDNRDLYRILRDRAVIAVFQPIATMADRSKWVGYEALSRISLPDCEHTVPSLFSVASGRDAAASLSQMMREVAVTAAAALPGSDTRIFLNVHPAEMNTQALFESLEQAADRLGPDKRAVAEIHETTITDPAAMRQLHKDLASIGVALAYDDFGAGRSRLMEIAEAPPDVVKLDRSLVRSIDQSRPRQDLVAALTGVMGRLGVEVLAECVETEVEWRTCQDLGCHLAQGYLIQRPATPEDLS